MPKSADKVIVTNQAALRTKYGAGFQKIVAAVNALVAADKKRGLTTKLVYLDSAADMKKLKAPRVAKATDPKQNKRAVDGVFKALEPDYLVLLGAVDVVPHQDLDNPSMTPPTPTTTPIRRRSATCPMLATPATARTCVTSHSRRAWSAGCLT